MIKSASSSSPSINSQHTHSLSHSPASTAHFHPPSDHEKLYRKQSRVFDAGSTMKSPKTAKSGEAKAQSSPVKPNTPIEKASSERTSSEVGPVHSGDLSDVRATPSSRRPSKRSDRSKERESDVSSLEGETKRNKPADGPRILPWEYEHCSVSDLVQVICEMLMDLISINDPLPLQDGGLTRFHSRVPPAISVLDYLHRLAQHATLSPPILLSMVYYIDKLCALYPAFTISSLTVHRFLIASATVASKGLSDAFWTNGTYARVGGVSIKELALLELELLWKIDWRIVPEPELLTQYYRSLVTRSDGFKLEERSRRHTEPAPAASSSSTTELEVAQTSARD